MCAVARIYALNFHLPKPLHGWREFFGEVGVIVLGVLIALGAQQLIERRNWQAQVRQANDAFKTELLDAAGNAYERLAVQRCLQDRLRAIADRLSEPGSQWRGMPETFKGAETYYSNVLPVVYRPPGRASLTDAWHVRCGRDHQESFGRPASSKSVRSLCDY